MHMLVGMCQAPGRQGWEGHLQENKEDTAENEGWSWSQVDQEE